MKIYEQNDQELGDFINQTIEKEAGKKVFTIIFTNKGNDAQKDILDALIVFEDKSVLEAMIFIEKIKGRLAARITGNYI
jgi:hydrogenase maturation factor